MTPRIDVASSETTLDRVDLRIGGAMPFVLARRYCSGAPAGPFGAGWQHGFDRTLRIESERLVYRDGAGRETAFAPVPVGMEAKHPGGLTLQHHADGYVVFASPLLQEVFRRDLRRGTTLLLERVVDASGNRVKCAYANGRLAEITGADGQRVRFAYTGSTVGQISMVGADGRGRPVRTFRYGADGTLVAEIDADGRTTEYAYQSGLMVRVGPSGGGAWLAQYDTSRRCMALWHSDGTAVHHLAYDPLRQTTRAVGTDGQQVLYRHAIGEAGSVVLERIDAAGESLNYYYDEAQRLIGYDAPSGTIVTFQRLDAKKGEYFQIDGEQRVFTAALGPGGLIASVESGDGAFVFDYDERFNLTGLTTPLGAAWGFERDGKGRVAAIASPAGRGVTFHRDGTTTRVEDAAGERLRVTTNLYGRLAVRTDRLGREQRFGYDPEGRLAFVEVGEYRVAWDRDAAGRTERVADSERAQVRHAFDGAGRVLSVDSGGGIVRFGYDLAGRISTASGDAGDVRFGYDERDRMVFAKGPSWTTYGYEEAQTVVRTPGLTQTFNAQGDLVEEQEAGGETRRYQFGPSGGLVSVETERGQETIYLLFGYDDDGRLVDVSGDEAPLALQYDLDGFLIAAESDGSSLRIDYDDRMLPVALHVGETEYGLNFDAAGRLASMGGATFTYDALDRCVTCTTTDGAVHPTARGEVQQEMLGGVIQWFAAPHSLAVAVRLGGYSVPVWGREEMRLPPLPFAARVVRALVFQPEAALAPVPDEPGPPTARWSALAGGDGFGAGLPTASALGCPWPALDFFALARDRYDPTFARRVPGTLPGHEMEATHAPDDRISGSHCTGSLQPGVWAERTHSRFLVTDPVLSPAGGISPTLAHRLYRRLTRP